jgi:hypothetical protein
VFNIYFAFMKVYCLFTLHVTEWGTRKGADHKDVNTDNMDIYTPHWDDPEEPSVTAVVPASGANIGSPGYRVTMAPVIMGGANTPQGMYAAKPFSSPTTARIDMEAPMTPTRMDSISSPVRRSSPTRGAPGF